jgi:hypothetical protein
LELNNFIYFHHIVVGPTTTIGEGRDGGGEGWREEGEVR